MVSIRFLIIFLLQPELQHSKFPENLELLTLTLTPDDTDTEEKQASDKQLQIGGGAATPQVSDCHRLFNESLSSPIISQNKGVLGVLGLSLRSNHLFYQVIQLRLDATPLLLPFIPTVFGENCSLSQKLKMLHPQIFGSLSACKK